MGIQHGDDSRTRYILRRKIDAKYVCDLCGEEFDSKRLANIHHRTEHICDKAVLDKCIGKVFTKYWATCTTEYVIVLSIDYSKNRVTVNETSVTEYIGNTELYARNRLVTSYIKTITIDDLKKIRLLYTEADEAKTKLCYDATEKIEAIAQSLTK